MREIKHVAIIGGGLIGMGWASLFLARGREVSVVDPRPESEAALKDFTEEAWPRLGQLGLTTCALHQAGFFSAIRDLANIDFVQESGPDRIDIKRQIVKELEDVIAADVIISSSSSSLTASAIQSGANHPERVLVGHPMNPPHMVPMVELVAGEQTSEQTMTRAEAIYKAMERVTVRVQKEVVGHLANRLTSALYREAVHIVAEGIASVADVDKAITYGPGMRWALMGPHLTYHMGGGTSGYRGYLDHLGPTQEARWQEHGTPSLTEQLKADLVAGMEEELKMQESSTLSARRDEALVDLFKLKQKYGF